VDLGGGGAKFPRLLAVDEEGCPRLGDDEEPVEVEWCRHGSYLSTLVIHAVPNGFSVVRSPANLSALSPTLGASSQLNAEEQLPRRECVGSDHRGMNRGGHSMQDPSPPRPTRSISGVVARVVETDDDYIEIWLEGNSRPEYVMTGAGRDADLAERARNLSPGTKVIVSMHILSPTESPVTTVIAIENAPD
jgi:hypothetical protein